MNIVTFSKGKVIELCIKKWRYLLSNDNNKIPKSLMFSRIDLEANKEAQKAGDQQKGAKNEQRRNSGAANQQNRSTPSAARRRRSGRKPAAKTAGVPTETAPQKQTAAPKKTAQKQNSSGRASGRGQSAPRKEAVPASSPIFGRKTKIDLNHPDTLKIIPLGGLGEIGKNMTVYECGNDAIIVDCGLSFPDDEMLGVDIVIPDFDYLDTIAGKLRGVFITHGHEDHIGALPYFFQRFNIPLYGTRLTVELIRSKLTEHNLQNKVKMNVLEPGKEIKAGCFIVEGIRVNHSIPDSVAFAIRTPAGLIVQTGDFKVDFTPVFDQQIDLNRFAQLGREGVLALLSDSTNAEKPGSSVTESNVGQALEKLFARADDKRIIIASFASNIRRVQQIIALAEKAGRKVALSGRSMENYTRIALELGYIKVGEGVIIDISEISRYRSQDLVIITTGSQGEPLSALSRMASGNHKQIAISSQDMIIISATPIPGNEKSVSKIINELLRLGSDVYYEAMYETHASGHACQDELKLILNLTKPKYFVPVHGEYRQLVKHAGVAKAVGVLPQNIILADIGNVIAFNKETAGITDTVTAGRIYVDGSGVGDVGSTVLRDRKLLAQDGLMMVVVCLDPGTREIISGPDIISRGFVYVKESELLIDESKELIRAILDRWSGAETRIGRNDLKLRIRDELNKLMYQKTKRNPMIIPVIMEV